MPRESSFFVEQDRYVSTEQLAEMFPYRAQTWRRWVAKGKVKGAVKPFGRVMIPLNEARRMMQVKKESRPVGWSPHEDVPPSRSRRISLSG